MFLPPHQNISLTAAFKINQTKKERSSDVSSGNFALFFILVMLSGNQQNIQLKLCHSLHWFDFTGDTLDAFKHQGRFDQYRLFDFIINKNSTSECDNQDYPLQCSYKYIFSHILCCTRRSVAAGHWCRHANISQSAIIRAPSNILQSWSDIHDES